MNKLTSLLAKASEEVRGYDNPRFIRGNGRVWIDRLANDMHQASLIKEKAELELAISSLARRLVDSGPMTDDFCPSFDEALAAVNSSLKRSR